MCYVKYFHILAYLKYFSQHRSASAQFVSRSFRAMTLGEIIQYHVFERILDINKCIDTRRLK